MAPQDIDSDAPADDDNIAVHPTNERASRLATEVLLNIEHDAPTGGAGDGRHKFPIGNDAARDAITNWVIGSIFLNTVTTPVTIQRTVSIDPDVWEDIAAPPVSEIPTGTNMLFNQASAPTGWTQDTSLNDRVLRIVSGTGAGTGGTWTISGITVDSHILTTTEMPAHTHASAADTAGTQTVDTIGDPGTFPAKAGSATGSTGGGSGHVHGLTTGSSWRPLHVDIIAATKD